MPINTTGSITTGTRANLIEGIRAKAMSDTAVDAVLAQATSFTQAIVDSYEQNIAAGEVGENGTGEASDAGIIGTAPVVLLYGRVQSGKTAAMVLTSALGLDNGFRVVIVLTADNLELVRQTTNRFRDLDGPRVLSTLKDDETSEWRAPEFDTAEVEEVLGNEGLVLVCAKNALHIPAVLQFLVDINAAHYPALIFDDEADAATPDNTLQARTTGRINAPDYASTIHRRVIENTKPGEEGESALETLPHSVYVQVTASPFVLLLQSRGSRIRPTVRLLLEPGVGYYGGEQFFEAFDPLATTAPAPPLILVPASENPAAARRAVPAVLAASVEFALVAGAARALAAGRWPLEGFRHLSHTSPSTDQHTVVSDHISRHLGTLRVAVRTSQATETQFASAYAELLRTKADAPPLADLVPGITSAVRQAQVYRINAITQRTTWGPRVNFMVGGNILGRGLTIDDLLVTYYLRQAQVTQMDTVLQHARMYGYREVLWPYTRVYVPRSIAMTFKEIHESERLLRGLLATTAPDAEIPIRLPVGTRATRPSAVAAGVRVYDGSLAQVAPRGFVTDPTAVAAIRTTLVAQGVEMVVADRDRRSRTVTLDRVLEIVKMLEPDEGDPGRWDTDAVAALLEVSRAEYATATGCSVYVRAFESAPDPDRDRARLSGPEIDLIRRSANNLPALALLYWERDAAPDLWFPTLVLPRTWPTFVFSPA